MPNTKPDLQFQLEHLPPGSAPNSRNLYFTAIMSTLEYR